MTNAFIIHGVYGTPEQNWFPWLKNALEQLGIETHVPHLPTTMPLTPQVWWDAFGELEEKITTDTILIGHSLGCAFCLNILEKHPVRAAYFVGPAVGETDNEFTEVMEAISDQDFDWNAIKEHCASFTILHSDNDPYLPLSVAETLNTHLCGTLTVVPGAGHFNETSGHHELLELLEAIHTSL